MCRRHAFPILALAFALGCRADASPGAAAARDSRLEAETTAALAAADTASADTMPADNAPADTFSSAALAQLSQFVSQHWRFDLDSMVARRALRVLVVPSRMLYFEDRGRLRGASYEMVHEFERALNKKFRTGSIPIECIFIPVPRDQLITRVAEGRGDLAVGVIQVTADRRERVDFSDPVYEGVREVVVSGPGAPELQTLEDLSGREVYVRPSSSYAEHLRELNQSWRAQGRKPVAIQPADENLEDGDILEMVNTGVVPITVVNGSDALFYRDILTDLTVHDSLVLASGGAYAWAMRKNTPQLMAEVNRFVRGHRVGTTFGNVVARRYFRDNPWIKNPASAAAMQRYERTVGEFRKAGDEFGLDPLLLLAQGYQESGLDQSRRSHAGAVGVMQIKPSTAASPPIGITGVDRLENNVRAGAKYLRFIIDRYYTDSAMTPLDREIFALASYNAGPARIAGIRRRAAATGLDPDLWFQHVEVLVSKEIGRETVDYVRNIYKYYLTYNLLEQRRQDRERAQAAAGDRR